MGSEFVGHYVPIITILSYKMNNTQHEYDLLKCQSIDLPILRQQCSYVFEKRFACNPKPHICLPIYDMLAKSSIIKRAMYMPENL